MLLFKARGSRTSVGGARLMNVSTVSGAPSNAEESPTSRPDKSVLAHWVGRGGLEYGIARFHISRFGTVYLEKGIYPAPVEGRRNELHRDLLFNFNNDHLVVRLDVEGPLWISLKILRVSAVTNLWRRRKRRPRRCHFERRGSVSTAIA
jgi:hypothetical protein